MDELDEFEKNLKKQTPVLLLYIYFNSLCIHRLNIKKLDY